MAGKTITIPYDYGMKERLNLLCSFDFDGRHYFIARDPVDNELVCRQMRWSIFKGTHQLSRPLSQKVLGVANTLLHRLDEEPGTNKFKGEHYHVKYIEKDGSRSFRYVKQSSCSDYFAPFMMNFSTPIRFVIALIVAAIYAFVYTQSSGMMWATTVFPGMYRIPLKIMLYTFELIGAAVLFKIRDEDRGWWDFILNSLIPLNLITIIGLAKVNLAARIVIICLAVLFGLFKVMPLIRSLTAKSTRKVKKKKVHRALGKMYAPVLICVLCCIYVVKIFGIDGYTNIAATKTSYQESETIMSHYGEALESINENVWKNLTTQQRIDALQSICDYECANIFGCRTATVQTGCPQSKYILGEYNHITNTILINVDHMNEDSVHDVVNTLLHETRHVYQRSVVNMLNDVEEKLDDEDMRLSIFQYASSMRANFDNYKSGSLNFEDYYGQSAEADSRSWAECETTERYDRYIYIDSLSEEKTTSDDPSELKEK